MIVTSARLLQRQLLDRYEVKEEMKLAALHLKQITATNKSLFENVLKTFTSVYNGSGFALFSFLFDSGRGSGIDSGSGRERDSGRSSSPDIVSGSGRGSVLIAVAAEEEVAVVVAVAATLAVAEAITEERAEAVDSDSG